MQTATDNATRQATQDDHASFLLQRMTTHDGGRITIPKRFREMYDVTEGDVLDACITESGTSFWALDLPMDGTHRIRLPRRKRELYDIEDGDIFDIEVFLTGLVLD